MTSSNDSSSAPSDHTPPKKRRPRSASRRRFLTGFLAAAPLAAIPAVAGGRLLRGSRPAKSGADGGSALLSKQETAARKARIFREAWGRRKTGLEEPQVRVESVISTIDLPTVEQAPLSPASSAAAIHFPIREAIVVRMRRELQKAMAKPIDQRKWIMVIDQQKCVGCSACTISCKAENQLPPGVVYRPVIEEEIGKYPNVTRRFLPRPCMQCENPPCTRVCPVAATWKQEDGIVVIDYNRCIGCRYCIAACPYGARYFDWGEYYTDGTPGRQPYEESYSPEYGRRWRRKGTSSPIGNVRKCQFCIHRLEAGMLPACVTTCIGGATYFGDSNDPENLVNELLPTGRGIRLKEEMGTEPKVYYLV